MLIRDVHRNGRLPFSLRLVVLGVAMVSATRAQSLQQVPDKDQSTMTKPNGDTLQVRLRLTEKVSSADAKVGQIVALEAVDPVKVNGKLVIAAGAHARAIVTTARQRGHNHRQGQLILTVQTVDRTDGRQARLQAVNMQIGSGKGEPIFGPCTFPLPADPVGLFRKGNDVVISKGTELVASIVPEGEGTVPARKNPI